MSSWKTATLIMLLLNLVLQYSYRDSIDEKNQTIGEVSRDLQQCKEK